MQILKNAVFWDVVETELKEPRKGVMAPASKEERKGTQ
jgi:hypothetical protein